MNRFAEKEALLHVFDQSDAFPGGTVSSASSSNRILLRIGYYGGWLCSFACCVSL